MITNRDVADLRLGDVVRVTGWDEGVTVEGPVVRSGPSGALWVGNCVCLTPRRENREWMDQEQASLTVVSRAPRPLYVNHHRGEPVPGDVVRDADSDSDESSWNYSGTPAESATDVGWYDRFGDRMKRRELPARLRLLVDGETGQAVSS